MSKETGFWDNVPHLKAKKWTKMDMKPHFDTFFGSFTFLLTNFIFHEKIIVTIAGNGDHCGDIKMKNSLLLKKTGACLILTAAVCLSAPAGAHAAGKADAGVPSGETAVLTGWVKEDGNTYYYGKDHKRVSGWKKIKKKWYYFHKKTKVMAADTIAGDKKTGYYYVGPDGIRVNNKTVNKAVSVVRSCTKKGMSEAEKVEACFDYIAKKCRYQHNSERQSAKKMSSFAYKMFVTKKGNCYMSASAVAYCAKLIGCPARVTVGGNDKNSTGHGWAEVKLGKKWYVYDASRQRWSYGRDLSKIKWKKFYKIWKNTRYKVLRNITYSLEMKGGKAVWKDVTKK